MSQQIDNACNTPLSIARYSDRQLFLSVILQVPARYREHNEDMLSILLQKKTSVATKDECCELHQLLVTLAVETGNETLVGRFVDAGTDKMSLRCQRLLQRCDEVRIVIEVHISYLWSNNHTS